MDHAVAMGSVAAQRWFLMLDELLGRQNGDRRLPLWLGCWQLGESEVPGSPDEVLASQRDKAGGLRQRSSRAVEIGEPGREGGDRQAFR
jgi:hypothetical protein